MACRLFGAKPLPEPILVYCQLDSWKQVSVKFEFEFHHLPIRKCIWKCSLPKWWPSCPGGGELVENRSRKQWMVRIIITFYYWKTSILVIATLSSMVAPRASVTTISGAANDDKIDIITTHFELEYCTLLYEHYIVIAIIHTNSNREVNDFVQYIFIEASKLNTFISSKIILNGKKVKSHTACE